MKLPKINKATQIAAAVVIGVTVGGFSITRSEAAMDWLGLESKLQNHDEQLQNHDDRINNAEADVEKLQDTTKTEPSTEKVIVREVVTQAPATQDVVTAPEPVEAPKVTVKAYEVVPSGTEFDCKYTYTDGTTHTFKWKTFGTTTSEQGKVLQVTYTTGVCDDRALGGLKG